MLSLMMAVTGGALEAKISPRRDDVSHVEPCCIMLPCPPAGGCDWSLFCKDSVEDDVCATCSVPGNLKAW